MPSAVITATVLPWQWDKRSALMHSGPISEGGGSGSRSEDVQSLCRNTWWGGGGFQVFVIGRNRCFGESVIPMPLCVEHNSNCFIQHTLCIFFYQNLNADRSIASEILREYNKPCVTTLTGKQYSLMWPFTFISWLFLEFSLLLCTFKIVCHGSAFHFSKVHRQQKWCGTLMRSRSVKERVTQWMVKAYQPLINHSNSKWHCL